MGARLDSTVNVFSDGLTNLEAVEHCKAVIVSIDSLAPEPIDIINQFHVVVEPSEDEFIATLVDANISMSGNTREEAVAGVKEMIVADFELFESTPNNKLGAAMRKSKKVLLSLLKRRA